MQTLGYSDRDGIQAADTPCLFAPLVIGSDLEAYALAHAGARIRAPVNRGERADVNEHLIAPCRRFDEPKTAFIVPAGDATLEPHALRPRRQ